ncbi:MAG: ribosome assembly RNA-binding protein YhbY [Gammaproteobacteria bacterium]|nr:MAG: ribosome assembly RNA-binding protein YhbY [Gammaproteobacteria bacterium]RTZ62288.1 MAG: ribosome assembly RNA-binding protein YhbY [Gammaproteobacteria bacterium]
MHLSGKQLNHLRSLAHHLNPVVFVGAAGLSEPVLAEAETALAHHELIKIKTSGADKAARKSLMQEICEKTGAAPVQQIGNRLVLYRPAEKPRITLP